MTVTVDPQGCRWVQTNDNEWSLWSDVEEYGYDDARCQGCVFNNPIYAVDMAPHTCSVQVELGRECGAAHGDKQRSIYILPGMLEAYKTRFAYQRMVRRSNP